MRNDDPNSGWSPTESPLAARWARRRFLTVTGAAAGLALTAGVPLAAHATSRRTSDYPFTLGVASGDPLPDGVVIWTRLAPQPLEPFGGLGYGTKVPVRWEVAEDEGFRRVVRSGTTFATSDFGHSVHVDVRGLRPSAEYYYRFTTRSDRSPVGRTKTAPAPGAAVSALTFAFVSCQHRVAGYYTAYQHMVREDLDVVFHLGDYIYEGNDQGTLGRGHYPTPATTQTLDDYRIRFAQYKTDPDLQAAHAAFPWVATLDDHDVLSNWVSQYSFYPDESVDQFLVRRANAFRAYWENMPLRLAQLPTGPDMPLYRRFTFGNLAQFNVLDTRQYRDDQLYNDGNAPPDAQTRDPRRQMLGEQQERWLFDGLTTSGATWNVLAQQVFFSQLDLDPDDGEELYVMDAWDGYEAQRNRVVDFFHERGIANPVVLTGDVHANNACEIKKNFDDPDSPTVGVELVGTSISSSGDGADTDPVRDRLASQLPHIKYARNRRGYVRCALTPDLWRTDFKVVPYVTRPGAPLRTDATFVTENGNPGLQKA